MRRTLVFVGLVGVAGGTLAFGYSAYATEREFNRLVAEGDQAVQEDRLFEGAESYSGAIALDPDAMAPYLKRGSLYRVQGEAEAALRDLRRAAELDPSATRPLEWIADIHLERGRLDLAAEYYQRAIALDDRNAGIYYRFALARYRAGVRAEAVTALEHALAVDPTSNDARFLLGLCQRDLHDFEAARRTLEDVVRRTPATVGPREALAEVYGALGEQRRAIDELEALSALEPARPERLVAVALAQSSAGRADQAIATLGRAMERFPDALPVYAALGHVWLAQAEASGERVAVIKAVEALSQAAVHPSSTSEALSDLGRALLLAGDIPGSERTLRQAVTRLPAAPDAFRHLATVTARQGRLQEARDALLQYVALVGDSRSLASVATEIADLSIRIGEPTLAVRWLDRAIDEAGPTPFRLARLASAAWSAGDTTRARAAVDEGLQLAPDDAALVALKRRVEPPAHPVARPQGG
jgi:tetratricopeptide (TPR) repeat protein